MAYYNPQTGYNPQKAALSNLGSSLMQVSQQAVQNKQAKAAQARELALRREQMKIQQEQFTKDLKARKDAAKAQLDFDKMRVEYDEFYKERAYTDVEEAMEAAGLFTAGEETLTRKPTPTPEAGASILSGSYEAGKAEGGAGPLGVLSGAISALRATPGAVKKGYYEEGRKPYDWATFAAEQIAGGADPADVTRAMQYIPKFMIKPTDYNQMKAAFDMNIMYGVDLPADFQAMPDVVAALEKGKVAYAKAQTDTDKMTAIDIATAEANLKYAEWRAAHPGGIGGGRAGLAGSERVQDAMITLNTLLSVDPNHPLDTPEAKAALATMGKTAEEYKARAGTGAFTDPMSIIDIVKGTHDFATTTEQAQTETLAQINKQIQLVKDEYKAVNNKAGYYEHWAAYGISRESNEGWTKRDQQFENEVRIFLLTQVGYSNEQAVEMVMGPPKKAARNYGEMPPGLTTIGGP